jgi:hypothetical protein
MPNPVVAVRACAGGHVVVDTDVVGILTLEPGVVRVFCTKHTVAFEQALRAYRREQMLLQV